MLTNIIAGCCLAMHFGYGPPDWKHGLNLIVKLTDLQQYINTARQRIVAKYPAAKKIFERLHIPEEIEIVPVVQMRQTDVDKMNAAAEMPPESVDADALLETPELESVLTTASAVAKTGGTEPVFFDKNLEESLMDKGTQAWLANDKNVETALVKLNFVQMQSGLFAAKLDKKIRAAGNTVTKPDIVRFIEELKDDCKNLLAVRKATADMEKRLDEFGALKPQAEEAFKVANELQLTVETGLKELDGIVDASSPEVSAKMLLQELNGLRQARHKLRDMREQIFVRLALKKNRAADIPKELYADELTGLRGRAGLEVVLDSWWKQKYNESKECSLALFDFVKFGDANKKYGIAVCDQIIRVFGQHLKDQFDAADVTGIYYGNGLLAASHHLTIEQMTEKAEQIRQSFAKTTFTPAGQDIKMILQLTAAVVQPAATIEETLSTLESALQCAKAAGKNRTFICPAGGTPVPAEVKDLKGQPSEVVLE
jgi:diguanylate cyclase (GGDEF)-like protein